jgi:hypothetical protein
MIDDSVSVDVNRRYMDLGGSRWKLVQDRTID